MMKALKKIFVCVLAVTMLMGMSTTAFGAEKESGISKLTRTNEGGVAVTIEGNDGEAAPMWWPGDGPAPQVTKILLYNYGWLENGNFGVILKVYGYGSDTTTFNGRSISWIEQEPFIISGTGADGFYYLYDCGPVTQPGNYSFKSTFRSTNFPYGQVSFSDVFTFSAT